MDRLNCLKTHPLWRSILEDGKNNWLFQLVLPHLSAYIPNNDKLNVRRVSKSWKSTMDRFLEKGQYEMYDLISECLVDYATTFLAAKPNYVKLDFTSLPQDENPQEVHRFRREMANSTGNPIVSRSVTIRSHWPDSIPFLQEFGVHIWHLNIHSKMERRAGIDGSHFRLEYARSLSDLLLNGLKLEIVDSPLFPPIRPRSANF